MDPRYDNFHILKNQDLVTFIKIEQYSVFRKSNIDLC